MPLAGWGVRRFRAQMPEIHIFQSESHTRGASSRSNVVMWRSKRVQCYHVAMREPLLVCGVRGRGQVEAGDGATGEWQLGSLI